MILLLAVAMQAGLGPAESKGLADRSFIAPAALEAKIEGFRSHPEAFGPLSNRQPQAIAQDESVSPSIPVLLLSSCPSAVVGLVASLVVHPIEGMGTTRLRTHVFSERGEGISPTLADGDSTASVVMEADVLDIVTAFDHVSPRPVDRSLKQVAHRGSLHSGTSLTKVVGGVK